MLMLSGSLLAFSTETPQKNGLVESRFQLTRSGSCRVVKPRTPTIRAKGPEKRNGDRNGKGGASQPTNVKAVMMR
jgi:hypothetical protein